MRARCDNFIYEQDEFRSTLSHIFLLGMCHFNLHGYVRMTIITALAEVYNYQMRLSYLIEINLYP